MHNRFSTCGEIKEAFNNSGPKFKAPSKDDGSELSSDTRPSVGDTLRMNDITREEFNARLETIEVKMDARVEAISSKIDGFLAAQIERDKRMDESITSVRRDIDRLGNLKLNIWGAMLTAVGLGVAVAALSVTFYQTGKGDRAAVAESPPAIEAPVSPSAKK